MRHTCGFRKPSRGCQNTPHRLGPHVSPTEPGVAADNDLCFLPAQSALCVRRSSPAFNGGDWPRPPLCAWLITALKKKKKKTGAERPRGETEREAGQADRIPGQPWRPGSASVGGGWKRGGKSHPSHLVYIKDRGEIQWPTQVSHTFHELPSFLMSRG